MERQAERSPWPASELDRWEEDGFLVLRAVVPKSAVQRALRLLNLEIAKRGLTAEEIGWWHQAGFFPHLRWEPEIWGLLPDQADRMLRRAAEDQWADPQLLLRFPDEAEEWPLEPHVDRLPEWAEGRTYRGVVGVALSAAGPDDGCPRVWPGSHRGVQSPPVSVPLDPGDALVMHPQLGHSGHLNRGPSIRYAVYFRLLSPPAVTAPPAPGRADHQPG